MFSCEFCEIFKNTFITEHLWTTPSISNLCVVKSFRLFQHIFNFTTTSLAILPQKIIIIYNKIYISYKKAFHNLFSFVDVINKKNVFLISRKLLSFVLWII